MDPIYKKFMIRRITSARQKTCYIDIFKLIVDHKIDYTVNKTTASSSICRLYLTRW